jgi:glycosyltransferase involved in cell wall biosynthesis
VVESGTSLVRAEELVAHFYTVHDDQDTAIRAIWSRCGTELHAARPVPSTGLPVEMPDTVPTSSALIAARRTADGSVQAIMRREHEILNVSVLLKHRPGQSWADLDRILDDLLGDSPAPLLGGVRLYLGLMPNGLPERPEKTVGLGREIAQRLPEPQLTTGWWHQGLTTDFQLLVWETGDTADDRETRRFAIVTDPAHEPDLSAWTWSRRGATDLPPFARYLMHVAKIRDQLRVRRQAPETTELCQRVEDTVARFGDAGVPTAAHLALSRMITSLTVMAKTVGVSWDNAAAAIGVESSNETNNFITRDHTLATWFHQQLTDDAEYLTHFDEEILRGKAFRSSSQAVEPAPAAAPQRQGLPTRAVLVIADGWSGHVESIATLNRPLCEAMARVGADVYCLVPTSTGEERDQARNAGVKLVDALTVPGMSERESLLRKPPIPDDVVVDTIIGHGRVTGQIAQALARDHFPTATHVHVVHVAPDQVEWYQLDQESDAGQLAAERSKIEIALAVSADRVVPVGPRLDEWMQRELHVAGGKPPVCLDPGFDLGPTTARSALPGIPQILLLARPEDEPRKGIGIAARATGRAMHFCPAGTRWELVIRGSAPRHGAALRKDVLGWVGHPAVDVVVRDDSHDRAELKTDLRRASLVLMPSRTEGFGLVGFEAVRAGTPALISDQTGLATLMGKVLSAAITRRILVPVTGSTSVDVEAWANRIAGSLLDLPATFETADLVRRTMAQDRTWAMAARTILDIRP